MSRRDQIAGPAEGAEGAAAVRPRTAGEILDDAWRLYLADAPYLLALSSLFLTPLFVTLLFLLARPAPEGVVNKILLPGAAALLVALSGLGSGACQELLRRRAAGEPVGLLRCLGASLRRGAEHAAARAVAAAGTAAGLVLVVFPGLLVWAAGAGVHAALAERGGRPVLREFGRETRLDPGKAGVVVLSRVAVLLLAALNLHLLGQVGWWVADNLGGLDKSVWAVQTTFGREHGVYAAGLVLLTWLLLAPYFEASNYLLYVDARCRQEGLDLLDRVRRCFPLGRQAAVLVLGGVALLGGGPARADEERREAVAAARAGVEAILEEVRSAEPYPGGERWAGRLEGLGRKLGRAEERTGPGRWFREAAARLRKGDRDQAVQALERLRQRLALLEEAAAAPDPDKPAAGPGGKPLPSGDEIRRLVERGAEARGPRPARAERDADEEKAEPEARAERVEPEGAEKGRVRGPGVIGPAPAAGFGVFAWCVLGGLLLAVLVVAAFFFRSSARPKPAKPPAGAAAAAAPEPGGPAPHELPAPVLWQQAEALARQGKYPEAVRTVYLAVLGLLHRARLVRYERTRTNGEYVRQVRLAPEAPPELQPPFERLTARFEAVWYGKQECGADGYKECRRTAEEIEALARP
jgi:hypothetical protein